MLATASSQHRPDNAMFAGDNKPTFRIKTREEVLDLTLVNRCAWNRVIGWHVSNVPSIGVAGGAGGPGLPPPLIQNTTNDKKL